MKLLQIIISPGHDYWVPKGGPAHQHGTQSPSEVDCVAGFGLVGDRYFHGKPNRKGQVTFFDYDVLQQIREQFDLPQLPASLLRRNLVVVGADLSTLLGQQFELQGVQFEGRQECRPCGWMDRMIAPGAKSFMSQGFRGGLRARVLTNGKLQVG
ncbi:MOSC domain-containing protein [Rubripirellula reticaptiva]|nr:MOSC domain-containing protein [Rubripirellula reticaptiva]